MSTAVEHSSEARILAQAILDRGAAQTMRHTIRLARAPIDPVKGPTHDDLSGAGVLVERNGKRGIITAAHCILIKAKPRQTVSEMEMSVLLSMHPTSARNAAMEAIKVPLIGTSHCGGRRDDGVGPDIAWIPLSPEIAASIEARSGVFYRMDDDRGPRLAEEGDDPAQLKESIAGCMVSGFSVEREGVAFEHGAMASLGQTRSIGPVLEEWTKSGWDYERRCIDRPSDRLFDQVKDDERMRSDLRAVLPRYPEYMGGLSGAGVWCLWQTTNGQAGSPIRRQLVGMVYFQDPEKGSQGEMTMFNHGRASLKRIIDGSG